MSATQDILHEVGQLNMGQLEIMPLGELDRLNQAIAELKETVLHYEQQLHTAEHRRFVDRANKLRAQMDKPTGTVRFDEDGFTVVADLPKRVAYDQQKLKAAVEALVRWGENPDDYVSVEIKVSESKYTAWPPAVRQLFEPARTLKTGKPSYKLLPLDAANESMFKEVV